MFQGTLLSNVLNLEAFHRNGKRENVLITKQRFTCYFFLLLGIKHSEQLIHFILQTWFSCRDTPIFIGQSRQGKTHHKDGRNSAVYICSQSILLFFRGNKGQCFKTSNFLKRFKTLWLFGGFHWQVIPTDKVLQSITIMLCCHGYQGSIKFMDVTVRPATGKFIHNQNYAFLTSTDSYKWKKKVKTKLHLKSLSCDILIDLKIVLRFPLNF